MSDNAEGWPGDDSVWRAERQREALSLMWEWDPLGIRGVAESVYRPLANAAVESLMRRDDPDGVGRVLSDQVLRLAADGYSEAAVERSIEPKALTAVVCRLCDWWATLPPP